MPDFRDTVAGALQRSLLAEAWARRKSGEIRKAKALRAARRDGLLDFIEYTKPNYCAGWFHRELCAVMERFLAAVLAGERPRYMISAPPQHGKSEIVSRRFPNWAQGQHPELRFICASYSSSWAQSLSGDRLKIFYQTVKGPGPHQPSTKFCERPRSPTPTADVSIANRRSHRQLKFNFRR